MTQTTPSTAAEDAAARGTVLRIFRQARLARALAIVAELGLADLVAAAPQSAAQLAGATGAHAASLYRLLRMLAAHGIFSEDEAGRFHSTPLAAVLRRGSESLRDLVGLGWSDIMWDTMRHLPHTVMTGEPAFERAYGAPFFDYLAAHPQANAAFDAFMAAAYRQENPALASAYDFSGCRRVVDLGGGRGQFLAAVLSAWPGVKGLLYDQPQVVAEPAALRDAGVLDRCTVLGGSFFESVPAGEDLYVLKRVLHDWDDAACTAILRRCREAMAPRSRVLVIDAVLRPGNEPDPNKDMDVTLMAISPGRERTAEEFRALFRGAGLEVARIVPAPAPATLSIVEGVAAP